MRDLGAFHVKQEREDEMRRMIAAFVFVAVAATAGAEDHEGGARRHRQHDCRVASIDLVVKRQVNTGLYHLTANPRAADGTRLTPLECPDQENVSWQSSTTPGGPSISHYELGDALGLELLVGLPPGPWVLQVGIPQRDWSAAKLPYPQSTLRVIESPTRSIIAR